MDEARSMKEAWIQVVVSLSFAVGQIGGCICHDICGHVYLRSFFPIRPATSIWHFINNEDP